MGLWYGAPPRRKIRPISWGPAIFILAHTAVCLRIAKSDADAVADACPRSLDLSPTQFALADSDAIEHTRSAAVVFADNFTFPACSASDSIQAARALIASSEWDQSFSLDFILWPSRSDPPHELVDFAAEHNKSIDIGFCK
eukprot:g67660.t1